jgi:hypothetical protein
MMEKCGCCRGTGLFRGCPTKRGGGDWERCVVCAGTGWVDPEERRRSREITGVWKVLLIAFLIYFVLMCMSR